MRLAEGTSMQGLHAALTVLSRQLQAFDMPALEVGTLADFIVLDRNLFEIEAQDISETQVLRTVFEGRVVFARGGG